MNNAGISSSAALPVPLPEAGAVSPVTLYNARQCNYPKFFKMDMLCKWALVATEYLFSGNGDIYAGINKDLIAVCLFTAHGSMDVDKRYLDSIAIASPALFVYTLPNIMLGEIC